MYGKVKSDEAQVLTYMPNRGQIGLGPNSGAEWVNNRSAENEAAGTTASLRTISRNTGGTLSRSHAAYFGQDLRQTQIS